MQVENLASPACKTLKRLQFLNSWARDSRWSYTIGYVSPGKGAWLTLLGKGGNKVTIHQQVPRETKREKLSESAQTNKEGTHVVLYKAEPWGV